MKNGISLILMVCLFAIIQQNGAARPGPLTDSDTLRIKAGSEILIYDSLHIFLSDTMIYFPDSIIRQNPQLKTYLFYQKIENEAKKSRFTKELYKLAFRGPEYLRSEDTVKIEKADAGYEPYNGKIIRNIYYKVLNVVGPTLQDTSAPVLPGVFEFINKIHPKTKNNVLRNNLLFKRNEELNPLELSNSERLLREMGAIKDAKIQVVPVPGQPDSVDVEVIVKDVFPIGARVKAPQVDEYDLRIWTVNFLGWGHRFDNTVTFRPGQQPLFRYSRMQYYIPNISGTFINGEALIERGDNYAMNRFSANRFYLPVQSSWGGLARFEEKKYKTGKPVYHAHTNQPDSLVRPMVKYRQKELAAGYSYRIKRFDLAVPDFFVASPAYFNRHYIDRPEIVNDTNFQYQHRTDLLGSISFIRNDYYKSRYINNFGISEDVPYGFNLTLTIGHELGELVDRTYMGTSLSAGKYFNKVGYFYVITEAGSFIRSNSFDQGLVRLGLSYFSKLITTRSNYRSRFSVSADYLAGLNRYPGERMYLIEDDVLKHIVSDSLFGNQQINFTASITTFTPWYFYGFRFAIEAFANMALIGSNKFSLFKNQLYTGVGLAVKIRNESLVFETIELKLTYFPVLPDGDTRRFDFQSRTRPVSVFPGFTAGYPEIIPYKYYYD